MKQVSIRWRSGAAIAVLLFACAAAAQEGSVNFNFDQVDVRAFVRLVGESIGRKFVVADDVAGKITVVSPQVSPREAYALFVSVLESAGYSVVDEGSVTRVVAMARRETPSAPIVGPEQALPREGGIVTKIIRLQHVSATDLQKLLESKVGGGKTGGIVAFEDTNHLIVTDTAESVRRLEKIVAELDQPGTSRMTEVVPLKFAGAESLAEQLNTALAESESRGEQLKRRLPAPAEGGSESRRRTALIVPAPDSNSLLLVGTKPQLENIRKIVAAMDMDIPAGRGRLNAIFLKYIAAEEAAKSMGSLLAKQATAKGAGGPQKRQIGIEAIVGNNAILVDASAADFEVVKKLIEQLDTLPQQVHITVLIVEHSLNDSLNLGVEMASVKAPSKVGDWEYQGSSRPNDAANGVLSAVQQGVFPNGLTFGVAYGSSVDAAGKIVSSYPGLVNFDALRKQSNLKIVSETSLEAQNNREASVSVVNEIPILKSTVQGGSGTARDVIQNIERVDVGIKLKLTPRVIEGGDVEMILNPSIEAVVDTGTTADALTPTIAKREVSTTVTVKDGRTIVIAGLTRDDKTKIVKKVPFLGSIPLIGWLFRSTVDATQKTNLLIFVTPKIMGDEVAAAKVMEDWKQKTQVDGHEAN